MGCRVDGSRRGAASTAWNAAVILSRNRCLHSRAAPKPFFNSRLKHLSGSLAGPGPRQPLSWGCQSRRPRAWWLDRGPREMHGAACPLLVTFDFTARIHHVLLACPTCCGLPGVFLEQRLFLSSVLVSLTPWLGSVPLASCRDPALSPPGLLFGAWTCRRCPVAARAVPRAGWQPCHKGTDLSEPQGPC